MRLDTHYGIKKLHHSLGVAAVSSASFASRKAAMLCRFQNCCHTSFFEILSRNNRASKTSHVS